MSAHDLCPFCGHDPYHYVDNGVGMEAVAVTCCELGIVLFDHRLIKPATVEIEYGEFSKIASKLIERRAMRDAIEQSLDDMGEDGLSVCEDAKQMLRDALAMAEARS